MINRRTRMLEDRYLRNSAKALFKADIEHLKSDFAHKGLTERATDRMKEGALDIYEEAVDIAEDNKGALAALLAAIVVWFARNPVIELLGLNSRTDEENEDYDEGSER